VFIYYIYISVLVTKTWFKVTLIFIILLEGSQQRASGSLNWKATDARRAQPQAARQRASIKFHGLLIKIAQDHIIKQYTFWILGRKPHCCSGADRYSHQRVTGAWCLWHSISRPHQPALQLRDSMAPGEATRTRGRTALRVYRVSLFHITIPANHRQFLEENPEISEAFENW
jgi:hypothetical protein